MKTVDWFWVYHLVLIAPVSVYSIDTVTSCELRLVLGLPSCAEDSNTNPNITYSFCNIPRRYLGTVKETLSCDKLQKYNPSCERNVTVAYSDIPPYIHLNDDGNIHGMLLSKFL